MLFLHLGTSLKCLFGINLLITACAAIAYYADSKRPANDPKKKNYHPLAIVFAPITFPILFILFIALLLLRALVYGVFTILFILALILIRKPFILEAIQKVAVRIGDRLMEANMTLVRFFLSPQTHSRGSS
jgi:hypothetical protein